MLERKLLHLHQQRTFRSNCSHKVLSSSSKCHSDLDLSVEATSLMPSIWHRKIIIHMQPLLPALYRRQRLPTVPLRESSNHNHRSIQTSHLTFPQPMVVTSQPRIVIERGETEETMIETVTETTAIAIGAPLDIPAADAPRLHLVLPLVNIAAAITAPKATTIQNTDTEAAPEIVIVIVIARATAAEQALKRAM
jgi:hypothetical protein